MVSAQRWREGLETSEVDRGLVWASMAIGLIDDLPSCAELIEFGHMMYGVVGVEMDDLTASDWTELTDVTCQILRLRLYMRNAQFSHPLSSQRIDEIIAGKIEPIAFDYDRAESYLRSGHAAAAE